MISGEGRDKWQTGTWFVVGVEGVSSKRIADKLSDGGMNEKRI
jgi:hypothetical protein